jgi:hypothetical protein
MERHYYVENEHGTSQTRDRLEAARIAAEWKRRGYVVETVVVDVTGESVQLADDAAGTRVADHDGAAVAAPAEPTGGEQSAPGGRVPTL